MPGFWGSNETATFRRAARADLDAHRGFAGKARRGGQQQGAGGVSNNANLHDAFQAMQGVIQQAINLQNLADGLVGDQTEETTSTDDTTDEAGTEDTTDDTTDDTTEDAAEEATEEAAE